MTIDIPYQSTILGPEPKNYICSLAALSISYLMIEAEVFLRIINRIFHRKLHDHSIIFDAFRGQRQGRGKPNQPNQVVFVLYPTQPTLTSSSGILWGFPVQEIPTHLCVNPIPCCSRFLYPEVCIESSGIWGHIFTMTEFLFPKTWWMYV